MTRKRVLVFTETALALSETFIADHCRSLVRYEPTLVALYQSGKHHSDVNRRLLFPAAEPSRLEKLTFRLGYSRQFDTLIKQLRPDIIHAHYLTNGAFLARYARRHGVPLVVTAHGHDATRRLKPLSLYDQVFRLRLGKLKQDAALLLPVSNYLHDILLRSGFPPAKVFTHYLGIPLNQTPPMPVADSPPRIAFVGRLVEKKGIDTALSAFAQIVTARPDAQLHVIGDGPFRPMVQNRAATLPGVTYHGAQPPASVRNILGTARMLVLPSRQASDGDVEGFGLVLLEAQALGLPVITSNTSGTSEALLPNETGFVVDPGDSSALAAACMTLLDKPGLAASMGRQAHDFVRQNFNIAKQTQRLEQLYDQVLANKPARLARQ